MKKNKKAATKEQTIKEEIVEKIPAKKKHIMKPWELEIMIIDEKELSAHSWFHNVKKVNTWNRDQWNKYLSIDQALKELNKLGRTYIKESLRDHWRFAGREMRLINTEDNSIVNLVIGDKEIYVRDN